MIRWGLVILLNGFIKMVQAQIAAPPVQPLPITSGNLVELRRSDSLTILKTPTGDTRRLKGNVLLRHKGVLMYCDLAVQNVTTNVIEAYGHVRIVQGDSIRINGDTLLYYGSTRQAIIRGQRIVLWDRKMTLTTQRLDYDLPAGIAHYPNQGRIVDKENVLTSREGYYDTRTKQFSFRDKVQLVNPTYTLIADSLLYNSFSKIALVQGPTRIVSKDGILIANEGEYNTLTRLSTFKRRATIETTDYTLTGDSLAGNNASKSYFARGNVLLVAKNDKTILTGDIGRYNQKAGVAQMTGNALIRSIISNDTLYMRADTLWSFDIDRLTKTVKGSLSSQLATTRSTKRATYRRLIGQRNVLVYKSDLQSKCDSIVYETGDSTIFFFRDPIVWSTAYQMEADSITAKLKNNRIHTLFLRTQSFVISQDTILNFNQIKGRAITTYFRHDKKKDRSDIDQVVVEGNSESIYFAIDEQNKPVGMNRVLCSKMTLRFTDRKIKKISFYGQPESKLIPPHELKENEKKLDGFNWRQTERPSRARLLDLSKPKPHHDSLQTTPKSVIQEVKISNPR